MKKIIVKSSNKQVQELAKKKGLELADSIIISNLETKEDEEEAVSLGIKEKRVIISCKNWKIIPLENLIAKLRGRAEIGVLVRSAKEAKTALQTMELGADFVVLESDDSKDIDNAYKFVRSLDQLSGVALEIATIQVVKEVGLGARSCIDTVTLMEEGEGMLVGSSSSGMFLVQAEVAKNELANPRPFRVNAGAVSMYVLAPHNKTKYLEEVEAGTDLILIARTGRSRSAAVGRSKIEIRPLVLIEARTKSGKVTKVILQNAETIRVVTSKGSIPVTELKKGDEVLVHVEEGGRHFGTLLKEETIIEK